MKPTTAPTPTAAAQAEPTTTRLTIDVWADVLCPWCYLGEHRLAKAIEASAHAGRIDLRTHTFQLDPDAPEAITPALEYLSKKIGVPEAQARAMEADLAAKAQAEGLRYELHRPTSNTSDMLRLVHLGTAHGIGWEYLRAMQAEVFTGNPDAFAHTTLISVGERLGIPGDEIRAVLASDRYADAVRADHQQALRLGARGVPFTVLGDRLGVPGAVSVEQYGQAIDEAWELING